jgi:hypothetical protein
MIRMPSDVDLAATMRRAYNEHTDPGSKVTDFNVADPDKREAWLVCARAALVLIFGAERTA